ncbi:BTB/POZ domain-containing protein 9-like [Drosophila subobscura]|uniref:BTB/POZ domain-containing protein 9-like n=1 Tax=Drosophila subobscura TaxID=7241 RepID=UPI00155A8E16|nr:BTB/POZ domain-containing protein 9-like [Drosophila subobscura]
MSSTSNSGKNQCCPSEVHIEDIHLGDRFMEDMGRRRLSEVFADVWLLVEDQRIPAHCVILSARSDFFRDLLYGSMPKDHQITLYVALAPFKVILGYIYTGTLSICTLSLASIVNVLAVAHLYGLREVEMELNKRLEQSLHLNNVFTVLEAARCNNLEELAEECFQFMDRMAAELIREESFLQVSKATLVEVLNRDTFLASEDVIFRLICEWSRQNPQENIQSLFSLLGLPLTSEEELYVGSSSGHIEAEKPPRTEPYLATLWPEKDVAYDKYFLRRTRGSHDEQMIDLRHFYRINCVSLIERIKSVEICYDVQVSCDQQRWDCVSRIIPGGMPWPEGWMNVYFAERLVRFIRIVNPENERKDLLAYFELQAKHTTKL